MQFQAHRDEARSKRREFEAYADEFEADSARKGETAHLQAAISELRQEFATTRGVFDEYNERFTDRVHQIEDISRLLTAATQLEAEFESTDGRFNAYAHLFRDDVERLNDTTELQEAIADLHASLVSISYIFDKYIDAFENDVDSFHDTIEENRRAFEATHQDFQAYSKEIQPDIEALRNPTDLLEAVERMRASIASREAAFQTYATDAFQDQLSTFNTAVDATRDSYDETERRFAAYSDDFHGIGPVAETPTETEEPEPDPSPSQTQIATESEDDAEPDVTTESKDDAEPDVDPIELATEESDATDESATASDSSPADDASSTVDADTDSQPDDMIPCRICGEYYKAITEPHLQTHDMTIADYRDEFGDDVSLRPGDQ